MRPKVQFPPQNVEHRFFPPRGEEAIFPPPRRAKGGVSDIKDLEGEFCLLGELFPYLSPSFSPPHLPDIRFLPRKLPLALAPRHLSQHPKVVEVSVRSSSRLHRELLARGW